MLYYLVLFQLLYINISIIIIHEENHFWSIVNFILIIKIKLVAFEDFVLLDIWHLIS